MATKRIYLVKNNESGAEELVRAISGASALKTLLTARKAYDVKVATVEEALAIQRTGQEVLDQDALPPGDDEDDEDGGEADADALKDAASMLTPAQLAERRAA